MYTGRMSAAVLIRTGGVVDWIFVAMIRSVMVACVCLLPVRFATAAELTVCAAGAPTCK